MGDASIRRAGDEDCEVLAELGRDTFVETFAHLYPPEDLSAFLEEAYAPEVFELFLAHPGHAMWIAEQDGQAIGYVHAGPCALPHRDATDGCGEVKRLYVRRPFQSGGLGGRLLRTAMDWLEAPGRVLWVGVWSQNHGAQRLYGRYGFAKVGEYRFPVGKTQDHEFIMRRG